MASSPSPPSPLPPLPPLQAEWEDVRKEMVEEKGLAADVADKIGHYVKLHGGMDTLEQLATDPALVAVKDAKVGLDEMRVLLGFCELFGVLDKVGVACTPVGGRGIAPLD